MSAAVANAAARAVASAARGVPARLPALSDLGQGDALDLIKRYQAVVEEAASVGGDDAFRHLTVILSEYGTHHSMKLFFGRKHGTWYVHERELSYRPQGNLAYNEYGPQPTKPIGSPLVYIRSLLRRNLRFRVYRIHAKNMLAHNAPASDMFGLVALSLDLVSAFVKANGTIRLFIGFTDGRRPHKGYAGAPRFEYVGQLGALAVTAGRLKTRGFRNAAALESELIRTLTRKDPGALASIDFIANVYFGNELGTLEENRNTATVRARALNRLKPLVRKRVARARALNTLKWPMREYMAKRLYRPGGPRMRAEMNAALAEMHGG
jgi:hypothetical protein